MSEAVRLCRLRSVLRFVSAADADAYELLLKKSGYDSVCALKGLNSQQVRQKIGISKAVHSKLLCECVAAAAPVDPIDAATCTAEEFLYHIGIPASVAGGYAADLGARTPKHFVGLDDSDMADSVALEGHRCAILNGVAGAVIVVAVVVLVDVFALHLQPVIHALMHVVIMLFGCGCVFYCYCVLRCVVVLTCCEMCFCRCICVSSRSCFC